MSNLSDEDKKAFRMAMQGVTPLKQSEKVTLSLKTVAEKRGKPYFSRPLEKPASNPLPAVRTLYSPESTYFTLQAESKLAFMRNHVPKKQFHALRSGQLPWQAVLDLHGMTREQAQKMVCQFIHTSLQKRCRVVLIIHGKGSVQGEAPILKNLTYHWLIQFPQINAFHSAVPKDGGMGAVYILLKK